MASSTKILKEGQKQADKLYKNMYNTALSALTSYGAELKAAQPTVESDIQKAYQGMRQTAQTAKETAMGTIGSQREAATRASESAIAEARRVASEQMQGLQARYGTATGTGGFTGELLGRETARNIATERGNLAGQMGQLDLATRQIESESANKMYEIDTAANKAINDARSSLRDQLAQINFKKGELEADKAAKRIGAIQSYTQAIANIQAQKEAEKRAIEGQKNMALFNLDIWKQQNAITLGQAAAGKAGTGYGSDFAKAAEQGREELMKGVSWGTPWDRLRAQFPNVSNEQIDIALGTQWRPQGAYQWYQQQTAKPSNVITIPTGPIGVGNT